MFFGLRFDLRNPEAAATPVADRYAAALDMAEWADRLGCLSIAVSEHHSSPDGYLPSPVPMVAAMAARTSAVRLMIAALIAPFHDPLRLAEDLIFLDNLSRGRIDVIVAGGYVDKEFELFGVPMDERARRVRDMVATLRAAFTGEPFEYQGRTVHLTPGPYGSGGPGLLLGGSSEAAARRAAHIADGFIPSEPEFWDFYRDEALALGKPDPGPCMIPASRVVALSEDAERGWEQMAPWFFHEMNAYGSWQAASGVATPYRPVVDHDELRASGRYAVLTPEQLVEEVRAAELPYVTLHPLCGGMPMDLAWESLRLFEHEVLPAFG
ncbi:MAG TPA: LLM class flavin-dependent oxidoreductase [Acidimicrobiales bacterium]|nr:LLM class flavin-dependent oxidoreductase [Acidimicrobiales bacterium]